VLNKPFTAGAKKFILDNCFNFYNCSFREIGGDLWSFILGLAAPNQRMVRQFLSFSIPVKQTICGDIRQSNFTTGRPQQGTCGQKMFQEKVNQIISFLGEPIT
jgi:hypothetical protein